MIQNLYLRGRVGYETHPHHLSVVLRLIKQGYAQDHQPSGVPAQSVVDVPAPHSQQHAPHPQ